MPINPNQGSTGGGTVVVLTGTNLGAATAVHFGTRAAVITGRTATSVSAVLPSGSGAVATTVTTPGGTTGPTPFYYVPPPVVLAVSPSSGPTAGGSTLTVTGRNLATVTSLRFGSTSVTPTVVSDTRLTVATPAAAAATVPLAVTTRGGVATSAFTFVAAPTATGFSPATGSPTGGTLVSITGTNLTTATGVTFGGVSSTFAVLTPTRIAAVAPAHALGTVTIALTTTGGTATAPGTFLYLL